jgi:hypothetical protein
MRIPHPARIAKLLRTANEPKSNFDFKIIDGISVSWVMSANDFASLAQKNRLCLSLFSERNYAEGRSPEWLTCSAQMSQSLLCLPWEKSLTKRRHILEVLRHNYPESGVVKQSSAIQLERFKRAHKTGSVSVSAVRTSSPHRAAN